MVLFAAYASRAIPSTHITCLEPFPSTYEQLLETLGIYVKIYVLLKAIQ